MTFTVAKFMFLLAVICFAVLTVLMILSSPVAPWLLPLGLAFGFAGLLFPVG